MTPINNLIIKRIITSLLSHYLKGLSPSFLSINQLKDMPTKKSGSDNYIFTLVRLEQKTQINVASQCTAQSDNEINQNGFKSFIK